MTLWNKKKFRVLFSPMGWWKLMKQSLHSFSQGIHICSVRVWDCRDFWGILTDPSVVAFKDGDGKERKGLILNKRVGISHIHKEYEKLLWWGNSAAISKHGREMKDFKWASLMTNHFFSTFASLFLSSITNDSDFVKYRTGLIWEAIRTNEFLARKGTIFKNQLFVQPSEVNRQFPWLQFRCF